MHKTADQAGTTPRPTSIRPSARPAVLVDVDALPHRPGLACPLQPGRWLAKVGEEQDDVAAGVHMAVVVAHFQSFVQFCGG